MIGPVYSQGQDTALGAITLRAQKHVKFRIVIFRFFFWKHGANRAAEKIENTAQGIALRWREHYLCRARGFDIDRFFIM